MILGETVLPLSEMPEKMDNISRRFSARRRRRLHRTEDNCSEPTEANAAKKYEVHSYQMQKTISGQN